MIGKDVIFLVNWSYPKGTVAKVTNEGYDWVRVNNKPLNIPKQLVKIYVEPEHEEDFEESYIYE